MISVIIPTCNRELSVVRTVLGLCAMPTRVGFEVIVANDGQPLSEVTAELFRALGNVRVVESRAQNVSLARNAGAASARGQILAFLDDDVLPAPGWLDLIAATLSRNTEVRGLTGRVGSMHRGTRVLDRLRDRIYEAREVRIQREGSNAATALGLEAYPVNYFSGGNCAIRREAFDQVGGFAASFIKSQDRELALRVANGQGGVYYLPSLQVLHDNGHVGWRALMRGRYLSGYFAAQLEREHPGRFTARKESLFHMPPGGSLVDGFAHLCWATSFNLGLGVGRSAAQRGPVLDARL